MLGSVLWAPALSYVGPFIRLLRDGRVASAGRSGRVRKTGEDGEQGGTRQIRQGIRPSKQGTMLLSYTSSSRAHTKLEARPAASSMRAAAVSRWGAFEGSVVGGVPSFRYPRQLRVVASRASIGGGSGAARASGRAGGGCCRLSSAPFPDSRWACVFNVFPRRRLWLPIVIRIVRRFQPHSRVLAQPARGEPLVRAAPRPRIAFSVEIGTLGTAARRGGCYWRPAPFSLCMPDEYRSATML
ncbi:uncharacterized protein K452DRAFT_4878 [Aplosporella prunicola CBS 121167]|uniref:Uncharacterized protein n=1 Tax=Aplosporella prunicola CBS 121167 TaxID=1176127 RepID=A0A6A6BT67_9PEZI|nr:uncharacterized protein K452DRAFT_4878 [Aplosporella prunicola CBS 121167]KAF2147286.1 hypothetical protein K452DRAFT_4878 [Aplosporella prunicola CBS 121167]